MTFKYQAAQLQLEDDLERKMLLKSDMWFPGCMEWSDLQIFGLSFIHTFHTYQVILKRHPYLYIQELLII